MKDYSSSLSPNSKIEFLKKIYGRRIGNENKQDQMIEELLLTAKNSKDTILVRQLLSELISDDRRLFSKLKENPIFTDQDLRFKSLHKDNLPGFSELEILAKSSREGNQLIDKFEKKLASKNLNHNDLLDFRELVKFSTDFVINKIKSPAEYMDFLLALGADEYKYAKQKSHVSGKKHLIWEIVQTTHEHAKALGVPVLWQFVIANFGYYRTANLNLTSGLYENYEKGISQILTRITNIHEYQLNCKIRHSQYHTS